MSLALDCALAFTGGALYEACCVAWVHFSETGRPGTTAMFSMVCAACQVVGLGESVQRHIAAPFFIVGYGIGTYGAVALKARWSQSSPIDKSLDATCS